MADKLGVLAGGGDLPRRIIATCRAEGRPFFVVAFEGHAEPETVAGVPHAWVRLGAAGRTIEVLRAEGVREVVMAGAIRRPSLASLRPDWWAARFVARSGALAFGDDGLLGAIVRELEEREGFKVLGVGDIVREILAAEGALGHVEPDDLARRDIARGLEVARGIGELDVGQAAVVQQGLVLAVEAIEGTDAMLARCGALRREGPGGVLVKVRKPGQETRADLPAIGATTVRLAAEAGLRGIAVEAGGSIILDRDATVRAADDLGLFVVGLSLERPRP